MPLVRPCRRGSSVHPSDVAVDSPLARWAEHAGARILFRIYSFPAIFIRPVQPPQMSSINQKTTHLCKVFTRCVKLGCVRRVREWASFPSLTLSDLEEFTGHVRGIWDGHKSIELLEIPPWGGYILLVLGGLLGPSKGPPFCGPKFLDPAFATRA
jgi:hypothetical protein